ncbi:DivIVA domain-containing protein [Frankia sp. CIT1]|uniref:DivIVA domain-containing protein n=1 Tax=Frankia sp. CIT1 TaxID=2880974 RepID=UPI001EF3D722|nr:DivIVA domain-containing protein [Frankia sp. CIT1]
MALSPWDVQNKVFSPTRFRTGYKEDEVDSFLDDVEDELTRLLDENTDLRRQLDEARRAGGGSSAVPAQLLQENQQLRRQLEEAQQRSAQVTQASAGEPPAPRLAAAQPAAAQAAAHVPGSQLDSEIERRVTQTLMLAQRTADELSQQARDACERARRDAHADAERIVNEARAYVAEQLGGLADDKRRLEDQVEQLLAFERDYRARLGSYLEIQLRDLDGIPTRPAIDAMAGTPIDPGTGSPPPLPPGISIAAQPMPAPVAALTFPSAHQPVSSLAAGTLLSGADSSWFDTPAPDLEPARQDACGMRGF